MSLSLGKSADGTRRAPGVRLLRRWPLRRSTTISLLSVLIFLALWQTVPALGLMNARYTSQPSAVAIAFAQMLGEASFYGHAWVSLQEFVLGFVLALAVAVPFGALLGTSRQVRLILDPPLMALYIAPPLVLLPILTIWLGIDMASKVAVVFLGAFFPIIVNTGAGMREADPRLVRAAQSFGAGRLAIFTHVLVPGALPSIAMGVRLAVGRGVLSVVVGELFVSRAGIGHLLQIYGSALRMDRLLVCALVVSAFGYALTQLVRRLEDGLRSWRAEP
ncbi:NitT/TauT family transport system permease protein [Breoghania corrubedonensis]|uniref:NitT/TauT family transport system permease protein n=1 Tax=Breoghania corrubedonensis TaxID=665038 RepID=A0A2T5V6K9_9HYPH|nr:ABC transporter permease [Breoghania corrubedonensis]PTW59398.1 NitT/TauT family transport system permease protein [Breoghania corrubedonensis]